MSGSGEKLQPCEVALSVVLVQSLSVPPAYDFCHAAVPMGAPLPSVQSATTYAGPSVPPQSESPWCSAAPGSASEDEHDDENAVPNVRCETFVKARAAKYTPTL